MSARFVWAANSTPARTYKIVGWALLFIGLVLFAFAYADTAQITIFDNGYALSLPRASKAVAFMIAILGLQVVVGYTGQLVLGQSFFFGSGAYIGAYMVADHNWPWLLSLVVVVPACFIIGCILGLPALRIRGLYLALVTLGMAATFPAIVQLDALDEYTGGAAGKTVRSDLVPPSWLPLDGIASIFQNIPLIGQYFGEGDLTSSESERIWKFFLFVFLLAVCMWLVSNLIKSRPGRALRAIRDNETSAAVSGVNLAKDKTLSFGLASALGGVGGVVYVAELGIASPLDFTQLLAINFIVGLVVGGVGTLSGAVIGGIVIAFIPDWSASTEEFPGIPERWLQGPTGVLILGCLLILLTFVLPGGVIAGVRRIRARILQIVPVPPTGAAGTQPSAGDEDEDDGDEDELRREADEISVGTSSNDPLTEEPHS